MPYDNQYNRHIADELNQIDRRYATLYAYSPVDGRGSDYSMGGSNAGVLFQMGNASKRDGEDNLYNEDLKLPPQYFYGNNAEAMMNQMSGGNGFAEGTFRDTGIGHQMGASSATGSYEKGMGMSGGNLFTDIYHGFEDLGSDIGKATNYVFGSGKPEHFRILGRMIGHHMKGKGMSGGSWWDSLKEGVSDVVGFLPELAIHAIGGDHPAVEEVGGAILGNPDPYPRQGTSQRLAGRGKSSSGVQPLATLGAGKISKKEMSAIKSIIKKHGGAKDVEKKGRGRPKGSGKKQLISNNSDLLAMPAPVALANGVPPQSQLRGAYGGAMPEPSAEVKKKVLKAVEKKIKTVLDKHHPKKGGKNLSGMTDKSAKVEGILAKMGSANLSGMTDKREEMKGGDKRKLRAELVKKIMKERGVKMIQASKIIKDEKIPY